MNLARILVVLGLLVAGWIGEVPQVQANEYGRIVDQCDEEERAARRRGDYSFDRYACANCRERERTNRFYDGVAPDSPCARFVSPSLLQRDASSRSSSGGSDRTSGGSSGNDGPGPRRYLRDSSCFSMSASKPALGTFYLNFDNQCGEEILVENACTDAGGLGRVGGGPDRTTVGRGTSQITCKAR